MPPTTDCYGPYFSYFNISEYDFPKKKKESTRKINEYFEVS